MLLQGGTPVKNQLKLFTEHEDPVMKSRPLELTTLLTMFRECFIAEGYASRADMDVALVRGEALLRHFFVWWQQEKRTICAIESGFKLQITSENNDASSLPILLSGRFDRVEKTKHGLSIIDYKTSARRTQNSVDADLQLSIYAIAAAEEWQEPIDHICLLFLSEHGVEEMRTTRSPSALKDARTTIRLLSHQINQKDFTATPTREKCHHCPYRDICPSRMS